MDQFRVICEGETERLWSFMFIKIQIRMQIEIFW